MLDAVRSKPVIWGQMVGLVANSGFYVLSQDSRTKGEGGIGGIQNIGKDYENIIKLFIFFLKLLSFLNQTDSFIALIEGFKNTVYKKSRFKQ